MSLLSACFTYCGSSVQERRDPGSSNGLAGYRARRGGCLECRARDSQGFFPRPFQCVTQLLAATLLLGVAIACGDRPSPTADPVLPHRMLLVASEGLYIVERDGSSSWSHLPEATAGQSWLYDLVYDGTIVENGNVLYGTSAYVREIDLAGQTVWEYAVTLPEELKSFVVRPDDGRVAVLHSGDQAILELERGTGRVLKRISLPAEGNEHTRYNYLRLTPSGGYLVALRAEERFVEVDREGTLVQSFSVPELPCMAKQLEDGSTLVSGRFGVKRFDAEGMEIWSLPPADVQDAFPMLLPCGFVPLDNGRVLVVNSDWHYKEPDQNRVPLFIVRPDKSIEWTLDVATFEPWKQSQTDPRTQLREHRCAVVQLLPET